MEELNKGNTTEKIENTTEQLDNAGEQNVLKRKRKKSNYKKINNETRQKLIEMVRVI